MLSTDYSLEVEALSVPLGYSTHEWLHLWQEVHRGLFSLMETGHLPFLNLTLLTERALHFEALAKEIRSKYDTMVVVSHPYNLQLLEAIPQSVLSTSSRKKIFYLSTLPTPEMIEEFKSFGPEKAFFWFLWQSPKDLEHFQLSLEHSEYLRNTMSHLKKEQAMISVPHHLMSKNLTPLGSDFKMVESAPGIPWGFACLSPAGLLPLGFLGIPFSKIIAGAQKIEKHCWDESLESNFAGNLALKIWSLGQWRDLMLCASTSIKIDPLVQWCCVLWNAAMAPTKILSLPILSASNPHNFLKQYLDHPSQKMLASFENQNHKTNFLEDVEFAKAASGIPQFQFSFDPLRLEDIGQLIFTWALVLVYLGALFEIDIYSGLGLEKNSPTYSKH